MCIHVYIDIQYNNDDITITSLIFKPFILGHIKGDLISFVDVSLVVHVSVGVGDEEEFSTAFVDDASHSGVSE